MSRLLYRAQRRDDRVKLHLSANNDITPEMVSVHVSEDWSVYTDQRSAPGSRRLTEYLLLHNRSSGQRIRLELQAEKAALADIQTFERALDYMKKDDCLLYVPTCDGERIEWTGVDRSLRYADEANLFVRYAKFTFVALKVFLDRHTFVKAMTDKFTGFPGLHEDYEAQLKAVQSMLGIHDIGVAPKSHPFVDVKPVGLQD